MKIPVFWKSEFDAVKTGGCGGRVQTAKRPVLGAPGLLGFTHGQSGGFPHAWSLTLLNKNIRSVKSHLRLIMVLQAVIHRTVKRFIISKFRFTLLKIQALYFSFCTAAT